MSGCGSSYQAEDDEQKQDSGSDTQPDTETQSSLDTETETQTDTETESESDSNGDCVHPEVVKDCKNGWCRVPPGCFIGGSPEDEMGHGKYSERQTPVTLTRAFELQQYEVTQKNWTDAGFPNNSLSGPNGDGTCTDPTCPMENINWFEALAYANRLSELHDPPLPKCYELTNCTGNVGEGMVCKSVTVTSPTIYECKGYRLPTTAESEYATRAGTQTAFYSGPIKEYENSSGCYADPNLEKIAWYCFNSDNKTHPAGQKEPNKWGLYDIAGNVEEWIDSSSDGLGYGVEPITDPPGQNDPESLDRVTRGGNWGIWGIFSRSACVAWEMNITDRSICIGTRLVRTLE
jgi:formylglycine-generating enzyme required for sulfatase activity